MWVSTLLLLSLCGGILGTTGEDDVCDVGFNKVCVPKVPFPWQFPKTAEDMDHLCPMLMDRLECLQDYIAKCGDTEMFEPEYLSRVLDYLKDVCNKDSKLHDDIATQLPCIKEIMDQMPHPTCRNRSREAMKVYEEHARVNDPEYSDDYYSDRQYCLLQVYEFSCFIGILDRNCGDSAKQLALNAERRTSFLQRFCNEKAKGELIELIQVLEIEMEERDLITEIISSNANA